MLNIVIATVPLVTLSRDRVLGDSKMAANPNFTKPWHGIPREEIEWFPTVFADRCMGCGMRYALWTPGLRF